MDKFRPYHQPFDKLSTSLGSTGIVTFENGNLVSQTKYKAWGEVRHQSGPSLTEYGYTGQYSYTGSFGLMYYNARWYDPALGRFAQADSIVPPGVQGWDRYAYANNNPIRFIDPSGHCAMDDDPDDCFVPGKSQIPSGVGNRQRSVKDDLISTIEGDYIIDLDGPWSAKELKYLLSYLDKLSNYAGGKDNVNAIFIDALIANGVDSDNIVIQNLNGMQGSDQCGYPNTQTYACWDSDEGTIILSDFIFTKAYQDSRIRPLELGLRGTTNLGIEVTIGHEFNHVFADARPVAAPEYYLRFYEEEESMANTLAFYIVTGKYDWPNMPGYFDFARDIAPLWQNSP